jgi:hypothetical protein
MLICMVKAKWMDNIDRATQSEESQLSEQACEKKILGNSML